MAGRGARGKEIGMRVVRLSVVTSAIVAVAAPALATPAMLAKVKEQGLPAQNCQYCHVSPMPRKAGRSRPAECLPRRSAQK